MANSIQLVFFDIGGVVIRADLERYVHLGCALFEAAPEPLRREVTSRVPALEKGNLDSVAFWKQVGERDLLASTAEIDPQVVGLCRLLQDSGVRIGALSNTIEDHIPVLTGMGVYRPFEPCVLSCRIGFRKPEREAYLKAANLAGLKLKECLLVDDLPENVEGARRAGMPGIVFSDADALYRELARLRLVR